MNNQFGDELMRMIFSNISQQVDENNEDGPVSQNDIETLETFEQTEASTNQCPVCFENLSGSCIVLNCEHKFHRNCITRWLHRHNTCPLCRTRVLNNQNGEAHEQPRRNINIVQRINMIPQQQNILCIHFIFSNGLQLDTKWLNTTKCYQILEFLGKFMIIINPVIKIIYNLGEAQFSFSSEDNMTSLNKTLHTLMIQNHAIMRVYNDSI